MENLPLIVVLDGFQCLAIEVFLRPFTSLRPDVSEGAGLMELSVSSSIRENRSVYVTSWIMHVKRRSSSVFQQAEGKKTGI